MIILLTIVHVIVCFFLVVVVLLQSGKAADLAGAFGGMGSQTAFGPRGAATVLSKATTIAAGLFMLTSLTLSVMATRSGRTGSTVLERTAPVTKGSAPAPAGSTPIQIQTEGGKPQTVNIPAVPAESAKPAAQPPAAPAKK
ncbi:MAG: preprotein translocase subunit SecG [Bryobacterales bacterium]|nr:preprotein translocase subunit SecG [Bryobacterales bacterium]